VDLLATPQPTHFLPIHTMEEALAHMIMTMMGTLPTVQNKYLELQRMEDGGMVAVGILISILSTTNHLSLAPCTLVSGTGDPSSELFTLVKKIIPLPHQ